MASDPERRRPAAPPSSEEANGRTPPRSPHAAPPSPRTVRRTPPRTRGNAPGRPRASTATQRRRARHSMDPDSPPARPSNPAKTPPIPDGGTPRPVIFSAMSPSSARAPEARRPPCAGLRKPPRDRSMPDPAAPDGNPRNAKPEPRPKARRDPFPQKMGCTRRGEMHPIFRSGGARQSLSQGIRPSDCF